MRTVAFFGRSDEVRVDVAPIAVAPRQQVHATVRPRRPMPEVSSAVLEWGYTNLYRYRCDGRRDRQHNEQESEDWVGITRVELPVLDGQFRGGSSDFRVPTWAPGSSPLVARWSCRLTVDRGGQHLSARGDFDVMIGRTDVRPPDGSVERSGRFETVDVDIALSSSVYRAGEVVTGHLTLTPRVDVPDVQCAVYLERSRDSHPLTRARAGAEVDRDATSLLDPHLRLLADAPASLPFTLEVPAAAPPSASAVHSSLRWFVTAELRYRGGDSDRVRRPIVVVNAP